ncbi:hypothetical protein AGRHK599_LOCUS1208 [Rhizobium rhizogenes]|uniref:Uncharacterized protein n=1 Tax=Rhizobium rhizogenes TaxID=359 RepID=A0AAN2A1I6_RHIRH|nr:hypothetical protein B0909_05635 [Rhizobium rhizogenes]OAM65766.1 hypothetical protein A8L48_22490 [Rhizobium rhizogenes]CAD0211183.1 hypothetical protein AGRHK599_LOCUS1208 [Rhizobium rhizogenes]
MSEKSPLTDNQAHDALLNALSQVKGQKGETVRAETSLRAAEQALTLLSLGLLMASEANSDGNKAIKDQTPS